MRWIRGRVRRGHVHQYLRRANLPCCFVPLARICLTPRDLLARQYLSSLRNPTTRTSSAHTQRRSWPRHRIRPPGALKSREAWHISSLSFFLSLILPPGPRGRQRFARPWRGWHSGRRRSSGPTQGGGELGCRSRLSALPRSVPKDQKPFLVHGKAGQRVAAR